jgi:predicted porin
MKKIVTATLLAGLVSIASAQVTISGKVSAYADHSRTGTAATTTQLVTEPTSNVAFSVSEKIGRDLTARGVIETSVRGNTIDGSNDTRIGDRQSTVGIGNKFGSIDLGRNVHSHFLAITNNDVFGTLYGSIAGDVHNLRSLRMSDAVYVSLNPAKNMSLAYEHTLNGPASDATVMAASARVWRFNTTVAQFEQGREKSTVLGVNTRVRGFNLTYVHSDDTSLVNGRPLTTKGDSFGVSRNFGHITAKASYGRTDRNVDAYALGADYNLSKRTALNLAYRTVDAPGAARDVRALGLGVTHRF